MLGHYWTGTNSDEGACLIVVSTGLACQESARHKLSPLIDRINDRYGRGAIGFGLLPSEIRAFRGHAAFPRVPERREF